MRRLATVTQIANTLCMVSSKANECFQFTPDLSKPGYGVPFPATAAADRRPEERV
jgi:hypothetical protein